MWSHYAASNTGICIEYDFNLAKIKNTIKNAIFPIAYSKQPINISDLLQDKKEKIFKHSIDAALLCAAINKADIWNYEHEWRWIIMLPIQRYCELRRIPLSAPKPSAIILGYHILKNCFYYDRNNQNEINRAQKNMDNLIKLLSYVKDNNILLYITIPIPGEYGLSPHRIDVTILKRFVESKFIACRPEDMHNYYAIHDELMDILES
mgnify:FL=1|jgi:hypothetical protein